MNTIDPVNAVQALRDLGYNYFVGAFGPLKEDGTVDVYHVVGYPEKPSNVDLRSLIEELSADETFDMTEMKYAKDYVLMEVDESFFE